MKGHRIIDDEPNSQFSKEFYKKEQKRAVKAILDADEFVLIAHNEHTKGGDVISCVTSKNILCMSYQTHKINNELFGLIADFVKQGIVKLPERPH